MDNYIGHRRQFLNHLLVPRLLFESTRFTLKRKMNNY